MSSGWHRHGPTSEVVHRDGPTWCDHPQNTPVLVVDLAGAREQIARAAFEDDYKRRGWKWEAAHEVDRADYLSLAGAILTALASQERGE